MTRALRRTWNRLLGSFSGQGREGDLADELEAHIQLLTDENIRRGLSPDEAHRLARVRFGSVEAMKERYRDQRGLAAVDAISQDLRYALRGIRRNPGFAAVVIVLIAIGIGANTALFTIINAVLLRPLPYPEPDRLVWVGQTRADLPFSSGTPGAISYEDFVHVRAHHTLLESIGAYQPTGGSPGAFLIGSEPVRMEIQRMSADAFTALKVAPVLGRVYANDEDRVGGTSSVVFSYRIWQERFGGAPIAGQTVSMNGVSHTILGVMPPGFSFPYQGIDAWLPLGPMPVPPRFVHNLGAIARLKPGVSLEQARAEIVSIAAQLEQAYPDANKGWTGRIEPMMSVVVGDAGRPLWILFGAVSLLLLIACSNVANVLLARASARQHEMGVRAALGASRARIVRQLLAESLLLSFIGAALALLLARAELAAFVSLAGTALPRAAEIRPDASVVGFAVALAALTGTVFGLAPAWMSSRVALYRSLQRSGGRSGSGERGRMRQSLIVAEVALTLLLLTSAGLLIRSFERLQSVNQGFSSERVISFDVTLPRIKYNPPLQRRFFEGLIENLRTLPGVEDAGITSRLPLTQTGGNVFSYSIEGQTKPPGSTPDSTENIAVSPGYFGTMGIQLLRGRLFSEHDGPDVESVVIVDDEFARRHWPGEDPIGRRIRLEGDAARSLTVVGVVGRVKLDSLRQQGGFPQTYAPAAQRPGIHASVVVKTGLPPEALAAAIREQVRRLDAAQPIHNLRTIADIRERSLTSERLNLSVLGVFASVALLLSVVGLYGVLAYSVAQRQREIGVRTALGARPSEIMMLVLGQGMRLTALGILLGIGAAFWVTQWLSSLLFDITPLDPATFIAVPLLLLAVALTACWIPARRAATIDPIRALREQ